MALSQLTERYPATAPASLIAPTFGALSPAPLQSYEGSDSCCCHLSGRSPHLLQLIFLAFRSQPLGRLKFRLFAKLNVTDHYDAMAYADRDFHPVDKLHSCDNKDDIGHVTHLN
jgi:hypothetical protein